MKQAHHWIGLIVVLVVLCSAGVAVSLPQPTKLLRSPAISDDHLVFIYAGDLWIADRDGANPRLLTVHEGYEGGACFSPDGRWVAFTGEYDGNVDAFVVSVDGGAPKRLTYHPGPDIVRGWSPGGDVMFLSHRESPTRRYGKFYLASPDGGPPEPLVIPRGSRASFSPDGEYLAYTLLPDPFATWKRYRGGLAPFIWIFDMTSHEVEGIPRHQYTDSVTGNATYANDTRPVWLGDTVYFLSDRDVTMNIFAYDTNLKQVHQLTDFQDFDIKSLRGFGSTLVFEQAGMIHVLDTNTGRSSTVDVYINPDLPDTRPHFTDLDNEVRWFEVSPTGKRALFTARGEVWTVPAEEGETRNITGTPAIHDRYPVWSPDGAKIAYLSDADGEYKLHIIDQFGREDPEVINLGDAGFFLEPVWSPEGDKILYTDHLLSLYYYDVEDRKRVKVAEDLFSSRAFNATWSPGGDYIAYTTHLPNQYLVVRVYDVENEEAYQITDGMSQVGGPAFSRDGKYLYFTASTNVGLNIGGSEMSSYERPVTDNLYLVVLQEDEPSPFVPESDEEEVKSDDEGDENGSGGDAEDADEEENGEENGEEEDEFPAIDFAGIDQRIIAMPVSEGNFRNLKSGQGGHLFYMARKENGHGYSLQRFSMEDEEAKEFLPSVDGYVISSDGKKLLYASGGGYGIVEVAGRSDPGDGSLDLSDMEMQVVPRDEWEQMFREVWRFERDFFYDPNMHGVDWNAAYRKYKPFVKYVGHRSDLNYLIGELIGELVVGHAYRWGGDMPDVERIDVGLLGADYVRERGRYRFEKIFSGQNWDPDERSPLTEPGVDISEGEYLLAVNGDEITADENLYEFFQNTAGKQTTLTVNDSPSLEGARDVIVKPIGSERRLRLRDWVEGNRRKVWEATDGRAAYVYMPNTAGAGYRFFTRYFFSQLDKQGVIIDERFNGGGHIADFVIDMLDRPLINFWTNRAGTFDRSPTAAIDGPKVMITNEHAGSGGDWLPYAFKDRELGTIVGKRTWGGLIGIGGMPRLIDGGAVTVPNFAFFAKDGEWAVENYGVAPDVEVQQMPKQVIDGHDPQLEKAIEVINRQLDGYDPIEPNPEPRPKRAKMK
ncbi:MAG: Tricorn protease [Calditrichaeota bacterium]|nr:Tricorn protease [Calditrichota bacterium]